mgnify:CR=1 FL=1
MSSTIKVSLLDSLYRARKNIERNKDIYMDSEHELLCEYYKKYQEQSKKFQNDKIKTTFNTFKIEKHILSESHNKEDEIILRDYKIDFEVFCNKYNKKFINEYQVDCDWNECGKYFASSRIGDKKILENFSIVLSKLGFENTMIYKDQLKKKLGTHFYNIALYTKGGILLHPGKLVRAMVDTLPDNVELLENSQLNEWSKNNDTIICKFNNHKIITKKIIFCTNGFLKSLGIKKNYNFPLTLTASMTRPLTDTEYKSIGEPREWGVLPVRPMGATIRMTKDKRILIRNTAEVHSPFKMSKIELDKRSLNQKLGIKKRFPSLADDIIESSWSGVVSRTRNSSQIFEKVEDNVFVAGCYNGSGIGVGTLFGEQIAIKASNENSDEINIIESRTKPTWLPPQPFLNIGVKTRLMFERFRSRSDV